MYISAEMGLRISLIEIWKRGHWALKISTPMYFVVRYDFKIMI
jgi:hypothetical protein